MKSNSSKNIITSELFIYKYYIYIYIYIYITGFGIDDIRGLIGY